MSDLSDFASFMSTPTTSNRYRLAREILSKELVSLGGELFAKLVSKEQLARMKETDPAKASISEMFGTMFGDKTDMHQIGPTWDRYIALGQVLQELLVLENQEDEAQKGREETP